MRKTVWLLTFVAYCVAEEVIIPTTDTLEDAKEKIEVLIRRRRGTPLDETRDLPFIAGFVRLAFHDCVGDGGCDGCIDHNLADNKGLERYTSPLDALYDDHYTGIISRADFYALASVVALEVATTNTNEKFHGYSDFKVGRIDCSSSPVENATGTFPSGTDGKTKTFQFFADEFGFNEEEATALMGAHTLGRCNHANSGFIGPWVGGRFSTVKKGNGPVLPPTSTLDNAYYHMIITQVVWNQHEVEGGKFQWQQPMHNQVNTANTSPNLQSPILLNSDMVLSWDIEPENENGEVLCLPRNQTERPGRCPHSDAHQYAKNFADSNAAWIVKFTEVFMRMIENNFNSELQLPNAKREMLDSSHPEGFIPKRYGEDSKIGILVKMMEELDEEIYESKVEK